MPTRPNDDQARPARSEGPSPAGGRAWLERLRDIVERNFRRLDALLEELKATRKGAHQHKKPTKEKR